MTTCTEPGCPQLVAHGYCDQHRKQRRRQSDSRRPSASVRGYDHKWRKNAQAFLMFHPTCIDCGNKATVPDHDPTSRADLLAQGVTDPDAWHRMKPRCTTCHNKRTAQAQPGGWAACTT